ncbi:MYO5 protein [Gonium pectorale]|uniref:MYO5 protein n=1 Tax=Gonium pectorale TaxID=33097 RepID=A0A150H5W8_GONPE|nr:MYO5 protein [Gonium pectorale]|eukprot:KXZ57020.1 MYO5 protein [Gonium pectorale]
MVDSDLGIATLAGAVAALLSSQQRIDDTELQLQALLRQHARIVAAGRLLEQQKVLDVLALGPDLGYDRGRPVASLLVYRCCLRWGSFGGDAQAVAVLDQLGALLLGATDEDAINARHTTAAAAAAGAQGGAAEQEDETTAAAATLAATREVAYWLAVTSTLLALVDPHLPLAMARTAMQTSSHAATPLAVVAGEARASVARATSAAAAKVQELQKRMGSTLSGMQALGKNLFGGRLRKAAAPASGGKAAEAAAAGAQQEEQQEGGAEGPGPAQELPAAQEQPDASAAAISVAQHDTAAPCDSPHGPSGAAVGAPAVAAPVSPPGQCFRQQLDLLLQKTYNQLRDSLKRQVSSVLPGCVQGPQLQGALSGSPSGSLGGATAERSLERELSSGSACGPAAEAGRSSPCGSGDASASLAPWRELVSVLSAHLGMLREAHVPRIIIRCLFKQTMAFINVQLFNQLLLRPDCCCTSNAGHLVAGLQLLDEWLAAPTGPGGSGGGGGWGGEGLGLLAEDLQHVRQASHFLLLANKGALRLDDFIAMNPALNVQQLYRLATTFWDDTPPPPPPPAAQPQPQPQADVRDPSEAATAEQGPEPGAAATDEVSGVQAEAAAACAAADVQADQADADAPETPLQEGAVTPDADGDDDTDAMAAAAAAAVAAAEAAAAADEAADAVAATASRHVSGEVLEEMKRRHAVANNGGLIVTFLLDEDSTPLIAPGGVVAKQLLQLLNEPRLREPLTEGLPAALRSEDCPEQVFAFLAAPLEAEQGGVQESAHAAAQPQPRGGGGGSLGWIGRLSGQGRHHE